MPSRLSSSEVSSPQTYAPAPERTSRSKRIVGARDLATEHAAALRRLDRLAQHSDGDRIFGAAIDVALGGADGDAGNGHALDQDERIALHDHAVGEGAAVALVGVADDVFLCGAGLRHGLPFDAGREAGAAAATQSGLEDLLDDRFRTDCERAREPAIAAMRAVIVERHRIDDAAAREGQPRLPLQPGDVVGHAMAERMVRAIGAHGREYGLDIA